jgi:two-component system CheB/CheR fusion protein
MPLHQSPMVQRPGSDHVRVVGIGASAGGLEACIKLLDALEHCERTAIILVQHLDPAHESMMVALLSPHTTMTVCQAVDRMVLAPAHLYVMPPGFFLALEDGMLRVSSRTMAAGARLPFDFLLASLARACGTRAVCVVLSGTGADGSVGLRAIRQAGGYVIVQDPDEATYDGMPRNAVATGVVQSVMTLAVIARTLGELDRQGDVQPQSRPAADLDDIVALLRARTVYDFTHYKKGTLERRVARRMAMIGVGTGEIERYLDILGGNPDERDILAKDLLINVTGFFRDDNVFDRLDELIVPEIVRLNEAGEPIRIWVAGCSTGEETYSLAMMFLEHIALSGRQIRLQMFASDVDPDAVGIAREGFYAGPVETSISSPRRARFFSRDGAGWRVSAELRACVVFTVQNVLTDPPFSRLDLVSCRNLLIYLTPEAQARVITLFHFALRPGGVLLLGAAETIGGLEDRFEAIAQSERLFRHVGHRRVGDLMSTVVADAPARTTRFPGIPTSRAAALAELGQRLVLERHAPASILIDQRRDCLFSFGPTDRYLRVPPGHTTNDLLSMARPALRVKLRHAIRQAGMEERPVTVPGGRVRHDGQTKAFDIEVRPVRNGAEELMLVCFVEARAAEPAAGPEATGSSSGMAELQLELDTTRAELQAAVRELELSNEEQRLVNEEAMSVAEEYQSTNEELLTSKEELQALNEELTALNSQLQEMLERQRTMADDLQNVLYSTDVATLFLDIESRIRFFTPATQSLFAVLPTDVGRKLADLASLAPDDALAADLDAVLAGLSPAEREIGTRDGLWYSRRVLPYRTHAGRIEGAVITFNDITERKQIALALEIAKQQAEHANIAKSRFLAVASHDLRQPLQTLVLLQGLLARAVQGDKAVQLVTRLDATLESMSGMLNTLLDINQIEAGIVRPQKSDFAINDLLGRLKDEFLYPAREKGLTLRVEACSLWIRSDPNLLEQIVRNLMSNALKYTRRGKVLLGCRRRGDRLRIEIWDTGIGIPESELGAIFSEYHQLDNAARERSRGLGLGLSIVERLGLLLDHPVTVQSRRGRGSVFAIEVPLGVEGGNPAVDPVPGSGSNGTRQTTGTILIVEDDPSLRDVLRLFLQGEGHVVAAAPDGRAALALIARDRVRPALILSDYNLPRDLTGLDLAANVRTLFGHDIPAIVLTGDVSADTLRAVESHRCVLMNKPIRLAELGRVVRDLMTHSAAPGQIAPPAPKDEKRTAATTVFVVDDDEAIRAALGDLLVLNAHPAECFRTCEAFLDAYQGGGEACLLVDAYLPGMSGFALIERLRGRGDPLPAIMITGQGDVPMAVHAMKAGAADFIEKPIDAAALLSNIRDALEHSRDAGKRSARRDAATAHLHGLTPRQREVMDLILAGHPNKNIAADLRISQRTVENHRAAIMKRTGSASLPALARLALAASLDGAGLDVA